MKPHVLFLSSALLLGGCDKPADPEANAKGSAAESKTKDAASPAVATPVDENGFAIALDPLPLTAKGPEGAKAVPSADGVAVTAFGTSMLVTPAASTDGATPDAGKAMAESTYKAIDWKVEDVDGGYMATFGSADSASKAMTFLVAHRTIGDKSYQCFTSTRKPEKVMDRAKAFCKSLAAK
jgi:hypothetical protein